MINQSSIESLGSKRIILEVLMESSISDKKKKEVVLLIEEINSWEEHVRKSGMETLTLQNVSDYLNGLSSLFDTYEQLIKDLLESKCSDKSLKNSSNKWNKWKHQKDYPKLGNDMWNGMIEITRLCGFLDDSESLERYIKDYLEKAEAVWQNPDEWKNQVLEQLKTTIESEQKTNDEKTNDIEYLKLLKELDGVCCSLWNFNR